MISTVQLGVEGGNLKLRSGGTDVPLSDGLVSARFVTSLIDTFTLDDNLSLANAVDLAWGNRHVRPNDVRCLKIGVRPYTTSAGAQVLAPTATFAEVLNVG